MATDALAFDARRLPQAARTLLCAVNASGYDGAVGDRSALELLDVTREHVNPRQAALFAVVTIQLAGIRKAGDLAEAKDRAAVAMVHLDELAELERLEDERTYTDTYRQIAASHAADLAVIQHTERLLGAGAHDAGRAGPC